MSIETTREVQLGVEGDPLAEFELFLVGDVYGDGVWSVQLQNGNAHGDQDACTARVSTPRQLRHIAYACLAAAEEMEGP